MQKAVFSLVSILTFSLSLSAQYSISWMKDAGMYNKTAVASTLDGQDNLIVAGYLQSENIYTRKYDVAGNLLWEVTDSSGEPGKYQKPIWITNDDGGNIFVAGKRYSIASGWEYPDAIIALKYSPDGLLLWKQMFPVTVLVGMPHPEFNLRCLTDLNGNLYIGSVAAEPTGFILIKLSPEGNTVFSINNETGTPKGFWSMRLKDNRIILAGAGAVNAPVMVFDTLGNVVWNANPLGRGANDVEVDDDGNFYIISSFADQVSSGSQEDIIIYKYSSTGDQMWKKDLDFGGTESPSRMILSSNKISITGRSVPLSSGYSNWITLQIDTAGSLLWNTSYNATAFNDEQPYFLTANAEGKVVVTGRGGPSPDPNNLSYMQMVILQYNSNGEEVWVDTPNQYGGWGISCMYASDNSLFAVSSANMTAYYYLPSPPTGINESSGSDGLADLYVYPNPFNSLITLSGTNAELNAVANIYDISGRPIKSATLTSPVTEVDLSSCEPGLYLCHVRSGSSFKVFKLVKE